MTPRPPARRPGYTLIELLIVIAIIGILAGLLFAAVQAARQKAKEVSVRGELSGIDTALGTFKGKMYGTPVPSVGGGPNGTFRLCSAYMQPGGTNYYPPFTATDPEIVILKRMFPRMSLHDNGLRVTGEPMLPEATGPGSSTNLSTAGAVPGNTHGILYLDPNQCLLFFLSGGQFASYRGFSTSQVHPFAAPATAAESRIGPFYEVQQSKLKYIGDVLNTLYPPDDASLGVYSGPPDGATTDRRRRFQPVAPWNATDVLHPIESEVALEPLPTAPALYKNSEYKKWLVDPWGVPYLYLSTINQNDYPFQVPTASPPNPPIGLAIFPWGGRYTPNYNHASPASSPVGFFPFRENQLKFVNTAGHQIISAGPNGPELSRPLSNVTALTERSRGFGPGSPPEMPLASPIRYTVFAPEAFPYTGASNGGDDFTNFHPRKLGAGN